MGKSNPDAQLVSASNPRSGRFFAFFSLTGDTEGILSVYIRLKNQKHYDLYERRAFPTAVQAARWLAHVEPSAPMYVVRTMFS